MEVHHHAHTPRKKWTHYFWEFLMLFLAVTLGFFVENQREHYIEGKREKEFIRSMIDDLKQDTIELTTQNNLRRTSIRMYDSVITLLNMNNRDEQQQQRLYFLARMSLRLSPFPVLNDRTYEQMKSSGNLRLIHKNEVADYITKYYFNAKEFNVNTSQSLQRLQSLLEYHGKVFDGAVFQRMVDFETFSITQPGGNPKLITEDRKILNELSIRIHYVLSILLYSKNFCENMERQAAGLIEVLKKEYHLK